jgi:hypothetical protein
MALRRFGAWRRKRSAVLEAEELVNAGRPL